MHDRLRNTAPIPLDWTADEAVAVATFLQEVLDSVWHVYGDAIEQRQLARREAQYELAIAEATAADPVT